MSSTPVFSPGRRPQNARFFTASFHVRTVARRSTWAFLCFVLLALSARSSLQAQKLEPIPALSFSTTYGQDLPLSQMITVASTGATFNFTAAATTTTGGAWLSLTPSAYGYGVPTPYAITVSAKPAVTLAAGSYSGQIVVTPTTTTIPALTIPVTLIVHEPTEPYFDQIAGGLTFTELTAGLNPPGQLLQVRNAGAGDLAWTAATSTSDGGAWLSLSAKSGSPPSNLTVSVVSSELPGAGLIAGAFTGQVVLKTTGDIETIPITMIVGPNVFRQINPLSFTKTYAGANPLSQVITMASTGTQFNLVASVQNSTGGSWLTITPSAYGYGVPTPETITVGVNPSVTLAAGTYMSEVIVNSVDGSEGFSIPVTLTVEPTSTDYFDDISGALDYSMETEGDAPPSQELLIRNAGTGTLAWTASSTTADGEDWLSLSAASGDAPDSLSVVVNPENLPGKGLVAGTFVGQVLLQNATGNVSVPVSFTVGANAFAQINPLSFVKTYGGSNPLPQVITVASTGANFTFNAVTVNSTGGSWLSIAPSAYGYGISTPQAITVSVNPAVTLAAGIYSSEIVITSETGAQVMTVPVTLSVEEPTATYFDDLPGGMSFSMLTKGNPPPAQVLPIRNAGAGTLDWTATTSTADGGAWLDISADSATAPSDPTVSVVPANLPGGGLVAGTFSGQVILTEDGNPVTVPVTMTVGANVFGQINPLNFTMVAGGANPLPQVITVASTGTNFTFIASAVNSTGGNWLSTSPSAYGYGISTPEAVVVTATPAATLAAGTYSSEIVFKSADGTQSITVPVTLSVQPKTATFFAALPGQLSFSMATGGGTSPSIPLEIRNAGAGSLAWTASLSTSDGGEWLSISPASGTAPSAPRISVVPASLPGNGLVAGTFTGQIILQSSAGDRVTIPVNMVVGASVFRQVNPLDFNMTYEGAHPLPQVLNITSTGTAFPFLASVANSTGGNWLSISPSAYGYGLATPQQLIVSVNPSATLAAGTYTAEIIATAAAGSPSMVIPVTLTVNATTTIHFDDMPGSIGFFQATGAANPAPQTIPIRNAGPGTLDWTATASTSDGGAWLTLSAASGTAPASLTVTLTSSNLPGKGLVAGIYNGQVVLLTGIGRATIPVQVVVGANVFEPLAPLSFNKTYGGSNPASQTLSVASTSANFTLIGLGASANGGNWLTISPSAWGYGISTPETVTVSASPATTLAAGSYVGEVIFTSTAGDQGMVVPVTLTVNANPPTPAATPAVSPLGGIYSTPQKVTITDSTPGAGIHYTLNGSAPTGTSAVYSAPLTITPTPNKSVTLSAIAIAPGYLNSLVGTAVYSLPTAATPTLTPVAGTYNTQQSVTISDTTVGATVYYTIDGTTPTTASTKYTGAITIPGTAPLTETIKAIATAPSYNNSAQGSATYTIAPPTATPVIAPGTGTYTSTQTVTITDTTTGATIYYTIDGTTPTAASTKYTAAITVSAPETVKAIAAAPNYSASTIASATYTFPTATPVIAPGTGTYTSTQTVTITDTTAGATIYYTIDGTTPTTASTKYTAAITVSAPEKVKAIAAAPNYSASTIASATYTFPTATPVIAPGTGTYTSTQTVTITDTMAGATIYYTIDGTTPTTASKVYSASISVTTTGTVLKAIAIAPGYSQSAVATATYTITAPPAATPLPTMTVAIAEATTGATVYYTTNGTTPTTSSTKYTAPITFTATTTLKFIAVAPNYAQSAVRTIIVTVQ